MDKTIGIQMKELLDKIEDEVRIMKVGNNRCCQQYEREVLDILDFERAKLKR
jgi:hypothetical protein